MGVLKPVKVKANDVEEVKENEEKGGGEPLSPMARMFHEPDSNIYIITMIGFKTQINPQVIKDNLVHTLLKHPRFSCLQIMDERVEGRFKWVPTTVDLDNHVIVPKLEPNNIDSPDKTVEDYVSNLSKTTIKMSIPMWDLHLLNLKTSNAESMAVFRVHHSLGDGTSLMSLFLASCRKRSYPEELPTFPVATFPSQTTLWFSNVPGPQQEVSYYGHPVAYIAPSCYGQPNGLMIHVVSYVNKMSFIISADESIIPDPHKLCDDLEESLNLIKNAVTEKVL